MNLPLIWGSRPGWLLSHSLQAGVLVLLVLLVQWLFRRQLTNRWRFALWWIVLARLLLPFGPESAVSLFNLFQPPPQLISLPSSTSSLRSAPSQFTLVVPPASPAKIPHSEISENTLPAFDITESQTSVANDSAADRPLVGPLTQPVPTTSRPTWRLTDWLVPGLTALWLAGVLGLLAVVAAQFWRFQRKLAAGIRPADPALRELLEECRREFGMTRTVELRETDAVQSPALFGLWRPRLLLPPGLAGQFSRSELRYIFLHELAHVQRGDLWLNWLVTGLQVLHWFNPLLWLGFARLRADRELACDELALLWAGDQAGTAYGETVVKLLENLNRPAVIPGLVGILEDQQQMRRRIVMIARFRRPGRWSVLAGLLVAALAMAALTDAQTDQTHVRIKVAGDNADETNMPQGEMQPYHPDFIRENTMFLPAGAVSFIQAKPATFFVGNNVPSSTNNYYAGSYHRSFSVNYDDLNTNTVVRPDLTGQVTAKGGAPLPVPATVFIDTASPKVGTSTFCPSCYADCVKHARTDGQGNFTIPALDPSLMFNLIATAPGYQPKSLSKVDPVTGKPVHIELAPIESADAAPDRSLRGRVLDPQGNPIEGAEVDMLGIEAKNGYGRWGSLPGIDPLAVTDARGEFLITARQPFESMDVEVTARMYAKQSFRELASGPDRHDLTVTPGASLRGRVLWNGQPLAGVSVGVSGVERAVQKYLGHYDIGTDARGNFMFLNLPPDGDFQIYTLMSSVDQHGAVQIHQIHTGKDGEITEAGDLLVLPAHRLAGRVVLADGQPVPPKTRLLISRRDAWDSRQVILGSDGGFDVTGIPQETVTLSAHIKGYHVSGRNQSVDPMNPFWIIGMVDRDLTNVTFLLEKGPDIKPNYNNQDPDYQLLPTRTLRGVEGRTDHSHDWVISGHVTDRATKQPIADFNITPGQVDQWERTAWNTMSGVEGSNGVYTVYVSKRLAEPLLKVEADGYLPARVAVGPLDTQFMDIELTRGTGPAGTVVTPDGQPVAGASLVLLTGTLNEAGIDFNGNVTARGNGAQETKTDSGGKFAFKPVLDMKSVVVTSPNGFGVASVVSLAANQTLVVQPYGRVTGTLTRTSGLGTNEILDLQLSDPANLGLGGMYLPNSATTDAQGRFAFDRVPPGSLHLAARLQLPHQEGWQSDPLQDVALRPGQTLTVNITARDRPKVDAAQSSYPQPPPAQLIPGVEVKGMVLLPDGQPAGDADVALQVPNKYLALVKGAFDASQARQEGWQVSTGPDGSFTLPMYEGAQSVIALNETGYAQVSLEQLKQSRQITLQKWGRIEGTLRVGHHLGTNEVVALTSNQARWITQSFHGLGRQTNNIVVTNTSPARLPEPILNSSVFKVKTDDQGRFVITFVPPGDRTINRLIPLGSGSWNYNQITTVKVLPGETLVTNLGGTGRTIRGTIKFADGTTMEHQNRAAYIFPANSHYLDKVRQLKTDAEREAFFNSEEADRERKAFHSYSAPVKPDGSFQSDDVPPGEYQLHWTQYPAGFAQTQAAWTYTSKVKLVVPPARDDADDSAVDWGAVELAKQEMPK